MDNKHWKLFAINHQKGCRFMPKMRLTAGLRQDPLGGDVLRANLLATMPVKII